MARPPGPVRLAVQEAARVLVAEQRRQQGRRHGVTYLDLQRHLVPHKVGRAAVRAHMEQLVREGLLVRVGDMPMPHSKRPLGLYALAANDDPQQALPMGLDLQALLVTGWRAAAA